MPDVWDAWPMWAPEDDRHEHESYWQEGPGRDELHIARTSIEGECRHGFLPTDPHVDCECWE